MDRGDPGEVAEQPLTGSSSRLLPCLLGVLAPSPSTVRRQQVTTRPSLSRDALPGHGLPRMHSADRHGSRGIEASVMAPDGETNAHSHACALIRRSLWSRKVVVRMRTRRARSCRHTSGAGDVPRECGFVRVRSGSDSQRCWYCNESARRPFRRGEVCRRACKSETGRKEKE